MKRVLFINVSLRPGARVRHPPVGLAYVMTAAKKAGLAFDFLDMDARAMTMEQVRTAIRAQTYDVYAMGCIVTGFRIVRELAAAIRESNPAAVIVAGNSVATSIPETLLKHTAVDIAVLGEGDHTIVELLNAINAGQDVRRIKGIAYRDKGEIRTTGKRKVVDNLDSLGFPDWRLFDLRKYDLFRVDLPQAEQSEHTIAYPLNAARGCPFSCTFCYHVFKGERYRKYSEKVVVEEVRRLHDEFHANFIHFWDELTFPNIPSVVSLVEQMERLPFRIGWEAITRGDLFRKAHVPLIKRMREAGCRSICFSIENASPEILAAMNKHMDVGKLVEHSHALLEGGVTPFTSIIFGYPQETADTIRLTLDLCAKCRIFPSAGFLLPLPGTPIYDWARQNGHIPDETEYLMRIGDRQDFHINLTRMPDSELIDAVVGGMTRLADKMGLKFNNVLKTTVYQKPKAAAG